jgi:hypothetical protein
MAVSGAHQISRARTAHQLPAPTTARRRYQPQVHTSRSFDPAKQLAPNCCLANHRSSDRRPPITDRCAQRDFHSNAEEQQLAEASKDASCRNRHACQRQWSRRSLQPALYPAGGLPSDYYLRNPVVHNYYRNAAAVTNAWSNSGACGSYACASAGARAAGCRCIHRLNTARVRVSAIG